MEIVFRIVLISFAWIFIQIFSGWIAYKIEYPGFTILDGVLKLRFWERNGKIYQKLFRVKTWKDKVPEAGSFFAGGIAKNHLASSDLRAINVFYNETLRAEFSHWLPFFFSWTFFLWNSWEIALWMPPVGFLGNLPFIIIQRYNRARIERIRHYLALFKAP